MVLVSCQPCEHIYSHLTFQSGNKCGSRTLSTLTLSTRKGQTRNCTQQIPAEGEQYISTYRVLGLPSMNRLEICIKYLCSPVVVTRHKERHAKRTTHGLRAPSLCETASDENRPGAGGVIIHESEKLTSRAHHLLPQFRERICSSRIGTAPIQ